MPDASLRRITLPPHEVPKAQTPVNADAAALAIELRRLRKALRLARWIPWWRRKRPQMQAQVDELARRRRSLRRSGT